jgi:hypothetical protein
MGDIGMLKGGGGACLVALARRWGHRKAARPDRSRTLLRLRRSRRLSREEGGRNNKFTTKMQKICMTCLNDMQRCYTA